MTRIPKHFPIENHTENDLDEMLRSHMKKFPVTNYLFIVSSVNNHIARTRTNLPSPITLSLVNAEHINHVLEITSSTDDLDYSIRISSTSVMDIVVRIHCVFRGCLKQEIAFVH